MSRSEGEGGAGGAQGRQPEGGEAQSGRQDEDGDREGEQERKDAGVPRSQRQGDVEWLGRSHCWLVAGRLSGHSGCGCGQT